MRNIGYCYVLAIRKLALALSSVISKLRRYSNYLMKRCKNLRSALVELLIRQHWTQSVLPSTKKWSYFSTLFANNEMSCRFQVFAVICKYKLWICCALGQTECSVTIYNLHTGWPSENTSLLRFVFFFSKTFIHFKHS